MNWLDQMLLAPLSVPMQSIGTYLGLPVLMSLFYWVMSSVLLNRHVGQLHSHILNNKVSFTLISQLSL
jgi:hypothetical protein